MTWANSDRRSRLPANWPTIRTRVLNRDHWRCRIRFDGCHLEATEVDHIEPGDDHRLANLQAVCSWCHAIKSASEGVNARAARRAQRYRPAPSHPGLIEGGE